jgi:polysaccharide biosynthesis transport protein
MKTDQTENSNDFFHYFYALLRHKWIIITSTLICVCIAIYHNAGLKPVYVAQASMLIDKETIKSPLSGSGKDVRYESWFSETMSFNTHFKLITSREVMKRAARILGSNLESYENQVGEESQSASIYRYISELKEKIKGNIKVLLGKSDNEDEGKAPDEETVMWGLLKRIISIQPIENTRLLNLIAKHHNPNLTKDAVNAVAQAYIEFNIDNRMQASQHTLKWLKNNLLEMKKDLEQAEKEFTDFKQKSKMISYEKSQQMVADKIREFSNAYINTRNRRLELESKLQQLKKISHLKGDFPQLGKLISNSLIQEMYNELIDSELELNKLSKVYKPKHPKILQEKAQIDDIRANLRDELKKEITALELEHSILMSKEKVIQDTISEYEEDAMATGRKELNHDILKRNLEMNQELYDTILTRLKEVDLVGKIDVSNVRIVEPAILPKNPVGHTTNRNIIIALCLGLLVGVAISLLWERLDLAIHTEEDIEKYFDLPVLCTIPAKAKKSLKSQK